MTDEAAKRAVEAYENMQSAAEAEGDPVVEAGEAADELAELRDKVLRMAAEMENYKKRSEREKSEFFKRANEGLIKDLLPIMDNLGRALEHAGQSGEGGGLAQGVEMVNQELGKVLERYGLEPVPSVGQPFDPEVHEAMMQQEDPDAEEGTVLSEYQKGYLHHGRLLRPAMVVVSKRPQTGDDDDGETIPIKVQ